jgi:hypothetical protein
MFESPEISFALAPVNDSAYASAIAHEITPAMIKAGIKAIDEFDELGYLFPDSADGLVSAIFVAMLKARTEFPSPTTPPTPPPSPPPTPSHLSQNQSQ